MVWRERWTWICGGATASLLACTGFFVFLAPSDARLTPLEIAEHGEMVAIGDSFSSGEGSYGYDKSTNGGDNNCHRSDQAYSEQLASKFHFRKGLRNVTCSGAYTENVLWERQNGERPQIDAIDDTTSLVTIGIAGNDADWVSVIVDCFKDSDRKCLRSETDVRARLAQAAANARRVYEAVRTRSPRQARVIAVGYPRFFPTRPTHDLYDHSACVDVPLLPEKCLFDMGISPTEQMYMNRMTRRFNRLLARQAAEAGVEFVDLGNAFDGHEMGTHHSYFNGIEFTWPHCGAPTSVDDMWHCIWSFISPETFHPNARGQTHIANLVAHEIQAPALTARTQPVAQSTTPPWVLGLVPLALVATGGVTLRRRHIRLRGAGVVNGG